MPLDRLSETPSTIQDNQECSASSKGQTDGAVEDDETKVLEGVDFTKFVDVPTMTLDEARKLAAEVRAKERPVDFHYIEQMKTKGVTEELAIKAFIGKFRGNEPQTRFFLNADFYYGSDAPTPLDRLTKAVKENTILDCIAMLEATKDGLDRGDHF